MKKQWLCLWLLVPAIAAAADISVGDVSLDIPSPRGFSPLTQDMAVLYEFQKQFVAPTNVEFAIFIPDEVVPAALRDEIPDLPRRFTVQTSRSLVDVSVSAADFEELKDIVRSQNEEVIKEVEGQLPGIMDQISDGLSDKYDVDMAFSVSQMVPMRAHDETDRMLAYSSLISYEMQDEAGVATPFVVAVTTTFAHVKGKVLFLYTYAEESGLDWSRTAAKQWADAIVAANPSDLSATVNEVLPSAVTGIDWREVGVQTLIGAAIGLVIGLIGWFRNRSKVD